MNMNKSLMVMFIAAFLVLIIFTSAVWAEGQTSTLTVVITGFKHTDGFAMIALVDSEEAFSQQNNNLFRKAKVTIENNTAKTDFTGIPFGDYAVSMYHDENANGKLDTSLMGFPKEPYGFSNNARGKVGKPDWEDVKFTVDKASIRIQILVK